MIGGAVAFRGWRSGSGLPWGWDVPVLALAVVLIGGIQHRLAGLGHESAHYTLLKNKLLNDLVGDLFCMFPILVTVHFYRLFHLAHHQYTNDPERDPDLVTLGGSKMVDRFPMSRWEFIKATYLRVFTEPLAFIRFQQDYVDLNVLGRSENVYLRQLPGSDKPGRVWPRLGAGLGLAYLFGFVVLGWVITSLGRPELLVPAGLLGTLLVLSVGWALPGWAFFQSPFRQPYSGRTCGVLRLTYYTWFCVALGLLAGGDGRAVDVLFLGALDRPPGDLASVLPAPARRLPAHQRRRRPVDEHPGVLHRPADALGGVRLRPGHARSPPPLPGRSPSPPRPAAPSCSRPATRSTPRRSSSATVPSPTGTASRPSSTP